MTDHDHAWPRAPYLPPRWAGAVFLGALALYAATLQTGPQPADAGEFQWVAATWGVAHPPGYALYTLLTAGLAHLLGFADPATVVSLFSAVCAASAVLGLARVGYALSGSALAGLLAAALLAFTPTFWAQATTANIRMLTTALAVWSLERLLAVWADPSPRHLAGLAVTLGAGVAHHGSLVFWAVMALAGALWRVSRAPRPHALGAYALALMAGALPALAWLYFPVRGWLDPARYGALTTGAGLAELLLARGFAGDMLFFATPAALPDRLRLGWDILAWQFNPLAGLVMLAGAVRLARRAGPLFITVLTAGLAHTFIALTYRAPQTVEYLLPAYAMLAGLTAPALAGDAGLRRRLAGLMLAGLAVGAQFTATAPSMQALRADTTTRAYLREVLEAAPPHALILANWHWATPLWYAQSQGARPDVTVRYVFPRAEPLGQTWLNAIAEGLPARPVLVTQWYPDFAASGWHFVPHGPAWQALAEPLRTAPPDMTLGGPTSNGWEFLGYRLERDESPWVVWTAWRAPTGGAVSAFVHVVNTAGAVTAQMDVPYPAVTAGQVVLTRHTLTPPPQAEPGAYAVLAGVYTPAGARLAQVTLPPLTLTRPAQSLVTPVFGTALTLLRADLPAQAVPGQTVTVALHWQALQPLVNDYSVRVELRGPGWQALSEGTPVQGAVPTLKWLAGTRLPDRHTLAVPPQATGPAQVWVTVYDAFTLQPLPTFTEAGQSLWLGDLPIAP